MDFERSDRYRLPRGYIEATGTCRPYNELGSGGLLMSDEQGVEQVVRDDWQELRDTVSDALSIVDRLIEAAE